MGAKQNFIAGAWIDGSGVTLDINPSDVSDVVGEFTQASKAQTDDAIASAKAASASWGLSTPQQRADALEMIGTELLARKDEIGRLLAREEGKPLANGIAETMRAAQIFKFFAQEALRIEGTQLPSVRPNVDVTITREQVGVVGLICPWNFPIAIPAWKIAPALAYGNCVVFKPADLV
jgi:alpha-ketoglutaric semialdehyde dehydrogenase